MPDSTASGRPPPAGLTRRALLSRTAKWTATGLGVGTGLLAGGRYVARSRRGAGFAADTERMIDAGSLTIEIAADPWTLVVKDASGNSVVSQDPHGGVGPSGRLRFHASAGTALAGPLESWRPALPPATPAHDDLAEPLPGRQSGWFHATRLIETRTEGTRSFEGVLETTDPAARRIHLRLNADGDGVIRLVATVRAADFSLDGDAGPLEIVAGVIGTAGVDAVAMGFTCRPGERFLGFGERSNAADQRGRVVENYVAEGPFREWEYPIMAAHLPPWATRARLDTTYYPIPWLLSTGGYGMLVDNDEPSYHRLGVPDHLSDPRPARDAWSVHAESGELRLRLFGGPAPADALERFTAATGRQPYPAAPWFFGPWFQPGDAGTADSDSETLGILRRADAPVSVAETHLHYLPQGDHLDQRETERARTAYLHSQGLAVLTYCNPMVAELYGDVFDPADRHGEFQQRPEGGTYRFQSYVGGRSGPLAAVSELPVAQLDFTNPDGVRRFHEVLRQMVDDGHDGWMEDFGEYTPLDVRQADGSTGWTAHNRYPTDYHRAAAGFAAGDDRPLARFVRSGWTGTAAHAPIVWGGDPTVTWGYDGLRSAVVNGLTMGMSGVSMWGSDIGGFFALGTDTELSDELLIRWIQFGAVSPVMRAKTGGVALPAKIRPQVWQATILPHWRRWAKLHTQLNPYLLGAAAEYDETGMPLMRHHALTHHEDAIATGLDDQYLFGPDLLAAPVIDAESTERDVYLPEGHWIDLWRSVHYEEDTGVLRLDGPATALSGGRWFTAPAPLHELPLLVRAGAVLPMLPADVFTLTEYGRESGDDAPISLEDRSADLELLAFPRGRHHARFNADETLTSDEARGGWTLTVEGARARQYRLQASLANTTAPIQPREITVDGRPLPDDDWRYDATTQVLRASFTTTTGTFEVR